MNDQLKTELQALLVKHGILQAGAVDRVYVSTNQSDHEDRVVTTVSGMFTKNK